MGAAPAYSYYPERAPERSPRERISVVPGRGTRTQTPTLPSNVVFLAKAAAVVLLVVSLVGFARIGLMSATISTTMQSSQLTSQISDARSSGAALEVSPSTLASWAWPPPRPRGSSLWIRTSSQPTSPAPCPFRRALP